VRSRKEIHRSPNKFDAFSIDQLSCPKSPLPSKTGLYDGAYNYKLEFALICRPELSRENSSEFVRRQLGFLCTGAFFKYLPRPSSVVH
jgi:hypothetical protein